MSFRGIRGAVSVVTGAAQGIGEAVARGLAQHNASVALVDCNEALVSQVAEDIRASGGRAVAFVGDVSDFAAVSCLVHRIEESLGEIDILVNAAGILTTGAASTLDLAQWQSMLAVNATGVYLMSQAIAKRMMPRRRGAIVTVGSNASHVLRIGMSAYAASKAAATIFTKCLGLELAKFGIRCNVVSPGSTDTPMQRRLWKDGRGDIDAVEGSLESFRNGIPLRRIAQSTQIAEGVLFLLSDHASHITMQDLCVDGGATLRA